MSKNDDKVFKENYEAVMVALSAFPPELEDRKKLIYNLIEEQERDTDTVKENDKALWKEIQAQYKLKRWEYNLALKFMRMKSTAERISVWARIFLFMKDSGYDIDYNALAKAKAGEGFGTEADNPVFDNTPAGSKAAGAIETERPGVSEEPIRVSDPVPTPGIPLEDAQRQFEENAHKAPNYAPTEEEIAAKELAIKAQREADEQEFQAPVELEGSSEADTNVVQMKRKGGRPKGSKNRPKVPTPTEALAEDYVAEQEVRLGPLPSAPEIAPAPPESVTERSPFDDDDAEVPDWLKKDNLAGSGNPLKSASPWRNTLETSTG
jgi:hypothetical protein